MQKMQRNGTHGSHFSVKTNVTTLTDENAKTIIIGAMIKILVLIARRVISRTRARLSCSLAIVGKRMLSMDAFIFVTMRLGNFCP